MINVYRDTKHTRNVDNARQLVNQWVK